MSTTIIEIEGVSGDFIESTLRRAISLAREQNTQVMFTGNRESFFVYPDGHWVRFPTSNRMEPTTYDDSYNQMLAEGAPLDMTQPPPTTTTKVKPHGKKNKADTSTGPAFGEFGGRKIIR